MQDRVLSAEIVKAAPVISKTSIWPVVFHRGCQAADIVLLALAAYCVTSCAMNAPSKLGGDVRHVRNAWNLEAATTAYKACYPVGKEIPAVEDAQRCMNEKLVDHEAIVFEGGTVVVNRPWPKLFSDDVWCFLGRGPDVPACTL